MMIVTLWTRVVTKSQVLMSGMVTMVNILIWYYVLDKIVNDISNWKLILLYALGCSIGTSLSTYVYKILEDREATKKEMEESETEAELETKMA